MKAWLLAAALAACSSAQASAPDAAAPTSGAHPFGTHSGYTTAGVIAPSRPSSELDARTAAAYAAWKAAYLVPGCAAGQYRIHTAPATTEYTVSEGHGYGMLITVIMAGVDPDARAIFDGLYAYYDAHRSQNTADLMAWAQDAACANVEGADSATDGDLDIAYALALADRQWGSTGAVDYATAAARVRAAILASDVHPSGAILVGDWATPGDAHYTGTRPSDFMTGHFRSFGAPGAAVVEHTYALVAALQASAAPTTGLLPDFVIRATGTSPAPAPANWLEGPDDGHYAYNACRVPWRIATDYLISGEARAQAAVRPITAWIRGATHDDPAQIVDGYKLDGTALGTSAELAFVAPLAVAAMVEPATGTNQPWLDALWARLAAAPTTEYYGDSLKLLAMIVVSGNWWAP